MHRKEAQQSMLLGLSFIYFPVILTSMFLVTCFFIYPHKNLSVSHFSLQNEISSVAISLPPMRQQSAPA